MRRRRAHLAVPTAAHPDPTPAARSAPTLAARLARALLSAAGWSVDLRWQTVPRCVIIVYPHTSNWDFVVGYLAKVASGLPAQWLGKDSLFRWPVAGLLRRMGGIPVDRGAPRGLTGALVRELEARPRFCLALAPEGTRRRTDRWRSGFYHLALAARVPVGLAWIDWRARAVGLSTWVELTGDEETDLERIRAVYAGKVGRHPEQAGEIRFRTDAPR